MSTTEVVSIQCPLKQLTANFLGNGKLLKCIEGPLKRVQPFYRRWFAVYYDGKTQLSRNMGPAGGGGCVKHGYLSLEQPPDFDNFDIEFRFAIYVVTVYINSRGNCFLGYRYAP
jgi:hypothetical protein